MFYYKHKIFIIFSLIVFVFPFVLYTLYYFFFCIRIKAWLVVLLTYIVISHVIGMYLRKYRTCGYAGGFFFGNLLGILGFITQKFPLRMNKSFHL